MAANSSSEDDDILQISRIKTEIMDVPELIYGGDSSDEDDHNGSQNDKTKVDKSSILSVLRARKNTDDGHFRKHAAISFFI